MHILYQKLYVYKVPTRKNLENLEKWESTFQSGTFEQTGKVRKKSGKIKQNTGKLWKFQTDVICYFLVSFKWTVNYMLKWIKFSVKKQNIKKYWKNEKKYWKNQGILSVRKKWEPWFTSAKKLHATHQNSLSRWGSYKIFHSGCIFKKKFYARDNSFFSRKNKCCP